MPSLPALLLLTVVMPAADDVQTDSLPSIAEHADGMSRQAGFFPFYKDQQNGAVLAEVSTAGEPFLYASGLSSGLGSNPVGLDRGQWGQTRMCVFKRVGKRVFLIEQNTAFRASSNNAAERQAVADSFADSIFWATDIVAATDDRVLINLDSLLLRDAHQVVSTLRRTDQGDYKFDASLSYVELERCKARAKSSLIMSQESSFSRSTSIARDWYHLERITTLQEVHDKIESLTVPAVLDFVKSHPAADFTILTIGPQELENRS